MFRFFYNKKNNISAFSLIELLVVLGIIGFLLAILIPRFTSFREQSKNRVNIANGHKLIDMLESYYLASGSYPYATGTQYIATLLTALSNHVAEDTTNLSGSNIAFVNPFSGNSYSGTAANSGNISVEFSSEGTLVKIYGKTTTVIKTINAQ